VSSPFFQSNAKTLVVDAVRDIESKTAAEIVVSVRAQVEPYRDIDLAAGSLAAMVAFFLLLVVPIELDEYLFPVEALVVFVLTSLCVSKVGALKRKLLSAKRRNERVSEAARAHFVEAGVDRTRDRSGILVFVALLEQEVSLVADRGIEPSQLGAVWDEARRALRDAVAGGDPSSFAAALKTLGDPLGKLYPRREDDVNELPDAPDMRTS